MEAFESDIRERVLSQLQNSNVMIGDVASQFGLSTKRVYQILQSEKANKRALAQKKSRLRQKLKSIELEIQELERQP